MFPDTGKRVHGNTPRMPVVRLSETSWGAAAGRGWLTGSGSVTVTQAMAIRQVYGFHSINTSCVHDVSASVQHVKNLGDDRDKILRKDR